MALGLNKMGAKVAKSAAGTSLRSLLENPVGFPKNYIPSTRELDGQLYIKTYARGKDDSNNPIILKWIFIDPRDNSATPDSMNEYAKVPESGAIMRVVQRLFLPFHENFIIDYYEDITSMRIAAIAASNKQEYSNKVNGTYRVFASDSSNVPEDLKQEIFSYPEVFFDAFIKSAIPDSLYMKNTPLGSNHISSLDTGFGGMPMIGGADLTPNYMQNKPRPAAPTRRPAQQSFRTPSSSSGLPSSSSVQDKINQRISSYTPSTAQNPAAKPQSIESTGLRFRTW